MSPREVFSAKIEISPSWSRLPRRELGSVASARARLERAFPNWRQEGLPAPYLHLHPQIPPPARPSLLPGQPRTPRGEQSAIAPAPSIWASADLAPRNGRWHRALGAVALRFVQWIGALLRYSGRSIQQATRRPVFQISPAAPIELRPNSVPPPGPSRKVNRSTSEDNVK